MGTNCSSARKSGLLSSISADFVFYDRLLESTHRKCNDLNDHLHSHETESFANYLAFLVVIKLLRERVTDNFDDSRSLNRPIWRTYDVA